MSPIDVSKVTNNTLLNEHKMLQVRTQVLIVIVNNLIINVFIDSET